MLSSFELFKKQLEDSVKAIELSNVISNETINLLHPSESLVDTSSLLARCESACKKHEVSKPTIRVIHHLACSGGSLLSKCISAMPNVYLLSEVYPFVNLEVEKGRPKYAPTDISLLTKYAGIPKQQELAVNLFNNAIDEVYQHVNELGAMLVLRDHTHADFNSTSPMPTKSTLISLLEVNYNVQSILTIRNPLDSYTSLVKNGWAQFTPQTFDEYCRRLLLLIKQFDYDQIFKYEEFLLNPQKVMRAMSKKLKLPFDDSFEEIFGVFKVTGDSGRSSDVISERCRVVSEKTIQDSIVSNHFKECCAYIGY